MTLLNEFIARTRGFTFTELLLALALTATLAGIAIPVMNDVADELRTASAARYLAGQIRSGRMDAVKRSASVGLRFEPAPVDYTFALYIDANRNGVRAADIARGIDRALTPRRQLSDRFAGVQFRLGAGLPDADGVAGGATDGVRIGPARILTTSPDGTATSGTLYVRGRRAQYAVRVLGATGRTRVLKYDTGSRSWSGR